MAGFKRYNFMGDFHRLKNKGDNDSDGDNLNNMMNETSTHPALSRMEIIHSIKEFRAHFPKL